MVPVGLEVTDLAWGPRPDRPIIAGIGFVVPPRSVTAIVGPNGAGKSTLLRCLYRHHRPTGGRVLVDGDDLWRMRPRAAARKIAAVLQETPADFPFTVREVVAMGRTPHRRGLFSWSPQDTERVEAMLARFDLLPLAERAYRVLSGGEKQRVLLARALAQDPGLVVLDEPTNHLDVRHQLEILELLRGIDITIVTTLHDLNLAAALADQVLVLRDGRLVGCGPSEEVLRPAMIRSTFDVDAEIDRHPRTGTLRFSFHLPRSNETR